MVAVAAFVLNGCNAVQLASGKLVIEGNGAPEGVVTAPPGSQYLRGDGGAGASAYLKESGTGNTGWSALVTASAVPAAQPRSTVVTSTGSPTPNMDNTDLYVLTALATNATFGQPSGTLSQGQVLKIRVKDDGTPRTLTWNAAYRGVGVALPSTTVAGKILYVGAVYNLTDTKWDVIAVVQEA